MPDVFRVYPYRKASRVGHVAYLNWWYNKIIGLKGFFHFNPCVQVARTFCLSKFMA
jgi:hypothetical protein